MNQCSGHSLSPRTLTMYFQSSEFRRASLIKGMVLVPAPSSGLLISHCRKWEKNMGRSCGRFLRYRRSTTRLYPCSNFPCLLCQFGINIYSLLFQWALAWSSVWPRVDSRSPNLFQDSPIDSASPLSCEDSESPWRLFIPVIIPD